MKIAPLQRRHGIRSAFTLIELVVVILIITVLLSLSVGVYFRVMVAQQASYTVSVVTRVQKALSSQYDAVRREAEHEPLPPPASNSTLFSIYYNIVLPMANNDPGVARVIWVKLRLRQAFPINFADASPALNITQQPGSNPTLQPNPILPNPFPGLYDQKLAQFGITKQNIPANYTPARYESSACLLLALQRSVSGGVPIDQVAQLSTQQFPTWGGGTIPVLVDTYLYTNPPSNPPNPTVDIPQGLGLNVPLAFCRSPTGTCLQMNLNGLQYGFVDPEDTKGLLSSNVWANTSQATSTFPSYLGYVPSAGYSYMLRPKVVSAGPDMTLGLDFSTFDALPGSTAANDNLSAPTSP